MSFEEHSALLDRFFAAIASGEIDAVRAIYAPGVAVWHNFDGVAQTLEQNLATLAWVSRHVSGLRYEEVRRQPLGDGRVAQQHVLRGRAPNGHELEVPAALFVTIADGRITRLEEYLDTAQVAALRA